MTALKSNSNTVWFNFQTYIIFSINLVSLKVTLRSSGTNILYGCHLLLDVYLYTPYAGVAGMLLHMNGKFTMGKLKSSLLS